MDNTPRKASDIILSLEQKVEQLAKSNASLDLNIKLLSNKLNKALDLLERLNTMPPTSNIVGATQSVFVPNTTPYTVAPMEEAPEQFTEYPQGNQPVLIQKNSALPISEEAVGFRRSSRPDTTKNIAPPPVIQASYTSPTDVPQTMPSQNMSGAKIAAQQRVVDKNGKAMFMADVEITNTDTRQVAFKGRTSAVGKWTAQLDVGNYKVAIRKFENSTKEKIECIQNLIVDGSKTPLELPIVIAK